MAIQGLPIQAFEAIRRAHFSERELAAIIPPRTLRHRTAKKQLLNTQETEQTIRLLSVQIQAELAFEEVQEGISSCVDHLKIV